MSWGGGGHTRVDLTIFLVLLCQILIQTTIVEI